MFTSLGRFRRHAAVLTVLSLVASVLVVAAPAAAAADPEADYKASFDACIDVPSSEFTDVADSHGNAGDIDCIAYYGITKGTGDGSTYSPLMSVTREQMALFLMRLAGLVGIEVAADPSDPGFTDTAGLSAESRTAIAQLADLGITKGTGDGSTYSPAANVKRGHMALFIARLMDLMTPMTDGKRGLSTTTHYGYTPADVKKNKLIKSEPAIGSPFTDLGSATKDEYDSITWLWELGVASGVSDTGFAPGADMTRAAMAGFMASALDHSNLRPAGLSIQASPGIGWGAFSPTVVVSMRDDEFMPVEDQAIDVFSSNVGDDALRKDGTCNFSADPDDVLGGDLVNGDCVWSKNDDTTDEDGNLIVVDSDVDVDAGRIKTFYAWIGSKEGAKFDADTVDEQTTMVSARYAQDALKITSTIPGNAHAHANGQKVDPRVVSSVTFTVQLHSDTKMNVTGDGAVARSGVKFRVDYKHDGAYANTHQAELVTDADGKVSWTVTAPADNPRIAGQTRSDDIVFRELHPTTGAVVRTKAEDIYWTEEIPVLRKTTLATNTYVLAGKPSVGATVRLWDQYGNSHRSRSGQTADITIGGGEGNNAPRTVNSRGIARWSRSVTATAGTPISVSYNNVIAYSRDANGYLLTSGGIQIDGNDQVDGIQPTTSIYSTGTTLRNGLSAVYDNSTPAEQARDAAKSVHVVNSANSASVDTSLRVTHVLAGEDKFLARANADNSDNPNLVYSYDSDDTFINRTGDEGQEISMALFELLIDIDNDSTTIVNNDNNDPVPSYGVDLQRRRYQCLHRHRRRHRRRRITTVSIPYPEKRLPPGSLFSFVGNQSPSPRLEPPGWGIPLITIAP